ncbi:indolepyruvate ferredoxin oxidoreductase family protein (plasmid) [Agrobacterium leguminum]|uniref:Pyruvate ferredoxin/flavodoxin oxidoreductase n=1 Tax=Agrobacterium deltaense NCPPB 1641 TaxID=1183425 RepID=A0A1S7U8Z2_9HYPH|nr:MULTISPECIES: indolepyruvate ferredoxin oxidoreductase family protein [Agrobacterium]WFS70032.1 indolepyruvate ferredoxin oxidoreductase family protein [Agrobacterium leguminum]CVI63307.1 Putative pyruvate ferredoxin/flavodoxin oxidoreductase [Agrobacterium deltaense NCPPB 1641]
MTQGPVALRENATQTKTKAALDDAYTRTDGRIFLGGVQALVRLPIVQIQNDRARGLNTAGFISGYRGSPLGSYDATLMKAKKYLDPYEIVVRPAVNEELGATAIWGSQQLHLSPGAKKDGVFGIWYGKGPGVDRCADVFKHGNAAGTSKHGGILCLAGDDHGGKSSPLPHQSDQALMAAMMPVLIPSGPDEIVTMGLLGIGMSRYSGAWVGMKVIADTVEANAVVDLAGERRELILPTDFEMPADGLNLRWPDDRVSQDRRLHLYKLDAATAFGRANGVDRVTLQSPRTRLGIVASGKAHEEALEALTLLGIDREIAALIGISVLKIGMAWPLDPVTVERFVPEAEEILVVEERREIIEHQIKQQLFNQRRDTWPRVVGKTDEKGELLLPRYGDLSVELIARTVAARLELMGMPDDIISRIRSRADALSGRRKDIEQYEAPVSRLPYFCAGCPHNTSTKVPEGSRGLAGIGCHWMVQWMGRSTETFTHMGSEGVTWVGASPFTDEKHIFVNLGDGTYFHSGILAIRQAVSANANITYKILFNDAVAMTGGQAFDGTLNVPTLSHQVAAEGVKEIYLVSATPEAFDKNTLASGTVVKHRDELDAVQKHLRDVPGCTVIIYDQGCATEVRRKRARGTLPKPTEFAFINSAVCEGCGDCSVQSNCVAIEPLETEMGRKREINQSVCNVDLSCLKGFCPSFVTVAGARPKTPGSTKGPDTALPEPMVRAVTPEPFNIVVTGVGGTGVLTVGHILGMAAHMDGSASMVLDMAGLAQKGGAVTNHVRISSEVEAVRSPRVVTGEADLLLAPDIVVATAPTSVELFDEKRAYGVVNSHVTPVAGFIANRDFDFRQHLMVKRLSERLHAPDFVDFQQLAMKTLGNAIAVNMMMVGYAWQKGALPITEISIRDAITLNGVQVDFNLAAFEWGRFAAAYPDRVAEMLAEGRKKPAAELSLDEILDHRTWHLTGYQDAKLAAKYRERVERIRAAERAVSDSDRLTKAVAIHYANVLAYKDEYEVARLYTAPEFRRELEQTFDGKPTLKFHLSPPLLARKDRNTGRPRKIAFGPWALSLFRVLAKAKSLRGTPLDVFGYSAERKHERELIACYEAALDLIAVGLKKENHAQAVALATAPSAVRGFGPVKEQGFEKFNKDWPDLLAKFHEPPIRSNNGNQNIEVISA